MTILVMERHHIVMCIRRYVTLCVDISRFTMVDGVAEKEIYKIHYASGVHIWLSFSGDGN